MGAQHVTVALALVAAACGSSKPHTLSANDEAALLDIDDVDDVNESAAASGAPEASSSAHTNCYFGDLIVARAGEEREKQGALLVKLTVDPSSARMVEETWSFPLYERYVVTRSIDGNAFAMSQDDGAFTGRGELHGTAWMWQGWTTTSTSADATVRVQSDTAFDDGLLVTEERVTNATGSLIASVSHSLKEVPLDECAKMFRKARAVADQRVAKQNARR